MFVAAIKTEADTSFPTLEQVVEIIGKPMRVLAECNFSERESGGKTQAEKANFIEQQEMYAAILNVFGKFTGRGDGSVTIAIPIDLPSREQVLTQRQQNAIALIDRWLLEDEDDHAESLKVIAESVDFHRRGYRTLFD